MRDTSISTLADQLRRWQSGWRLCRRLAPGEPMSMGLRFRVGLPGREHEILALHADDDYQRLRQEACELRASTWLTVPTCQPAIVRELLWEAGLRFVNENETFMSVDLDQHPGLAVVPPYRVDTEHTESLTRARVRAPSGVVAAHGTLAVVGADAIAHDIVTTPAHRRRGLAGAMMSALAYQAREQGATTGLLVASPQGRKLYESLGWRPAATVLTVTC